MGSRSRIAHPFPGKVRLVSFLHLACWPVAIASVGLLVTGMIREDPRFLQATIAGVAGFTLMIGAAIVLGHRLNCSVCANPVFSVKACRKHGRARRFLGFSYRLGVAMDSLIRSRFRCMYCGERVPLQPKAQRHHRKAASAADPNSDTHGERLILTPGVELPPRKR